MLGTAVRIVLSRLALQVVEFTEFATREHVNARTGGLESRVPSRSAIPSVRTEEFVWITYAIVLILSREVHVRIEHVANHVRNMEYVIQKQENAFAITCIGEKIVNLRPVLEVLIRVH